MKFSDVKVGQLLGATFSCTDDHQELGFGPCYSTKDLSKKYGFRVLATIPHNGHACWIKTQDVKTQEVDWYFSDDENCTNWQLIEDVP